MWDYFKEFLDEFCSHKLFKLFLCNTKKLTSLLEIVSVYDFGVFIFVHTKDMRWHFTISLEKFKANGRCSTSIVRSTTKSVLHSQLFDCLKEIIEINTSWNSHKSLSYTSVGMPR